MINKDKGLNGSHKGRRQETDRQNKKDRRLGTTRSKLAPNRERTYETKSKRPNALHERQESKQKAKKTIANTELYLVPGLLQMHTLAPGAAAS